MLSTNDEKIHLHLMMLGDKESRYRFKIILFEDKEYTVPVPQIRKMTIVIMMSTYENGYIVSMTKELMILYQKA